MKPIRYGIVGCGYVGNSLAQILTQIPGAEVVSVFDTSMENARAAATLSGATISPSADELCARFDVDAVLIATPNSMHVSPALCAAAHGKHIFCEKPIALTFSDCTRMLRAAQRAGTLFMAGHVMHFFRGVDTLKNHIAEGKIGRLLFCHAARNGWEDRQPTVSWKKIRALSGGHLMHHIHELDLVISLMGTPHIVTMAGGNLAHRGEGFGDEDDMLFLLLEYADGTHALLEYGNAFRWQEHYVLLQGDSGAIRLDMSDVGGTLRTRDGEFHFLVHETAMEDADRTHLNHRSEMDGSIAYGRPGLTMPLWLHSAMEKEMRVFHQAVSQGRPPIEYEYLFTGKMALDSVRTAEAALLSLQENRKVHVSEIDERTRNT